MKSGSEILEELASESGYQIRIAWFFLAMVDDTDLSSFAEFYEKVFAAVPISEDKW